MRFSLPRNIAPWLLAVVLTLTGANTSRADEALRRVQQSLRDQGFYYGSIDGSPGDETTQAIRRYQIRNGLAVTGQLNDETRNSITRAGAASDNPTVPSRGPGANNGSTRPPSTVPAPSATNPGSRSVPAPAPATNEPDYRLAPRQVVRPPASGQGTINGDDEDDEDRPDNSNPAPPSRGAQSRPDLRANPPQQGYGGNPPSARYGSAPSPTLTALFEQTPYEFAPPAVQADLLRRVQTQLGRSGFYDGEADGVPSRRTAEAIVNFQEVNRLRRTAHLDINTLGALRLLPPGRPRGYSGGPGTIYEGRIVQ